MNRRKMVVVIPKLAGKYRTAIEDAAAERGFEAAFFDGEEEATAALAEAEIAFGVSDLLARRAPKLRWLCTPSAGVNQFAAPGTFASPDAMLSNSSGAYGVTISEHIVMMTLEMLRRQPEYSAIVARREWIRDLPVRSIRDSRIALLGTGDIGREAAVRLRAFAPKWIVGVNRSGRATEGFFDRVVPLGELDAVLAGTDILIMSLPGTDETRHLMDARRLALLPDGALLVNVGRGTSVDQAALERELRAGRLRAALDVFEQEPLPADDGLWDCPGLLITPHSAGNTTLPYTLQRIVEMFLEDFDNYCAGRPLARRVDLRRGY